MIQSGRTAPFTSHAENPSQATLHFGEHIQQQAVGCGSSPPGNGLPRSWPIEASQIAAVVTKMVTSDANNYCKVMTHNELLQEVWARRTPTTPGWCAAW